MRAENAVAFPHVACNPDRRSFLSDRQVTRALHDALRYHVPDFLFDNADEDHPLKACREGVDVVRLYCKRLVIALGVRKAAEVGGALDQRAVDANPHEISGYARRCRRSRRRSETCSSGAESIA